jgi:hypothetical protein
MAEREANEPLSRVERLAVRRLHALAKTWPASLWVFCANGRLYVMRKAPDGTHALTHDGGIDSAYIADQINIEADGGDW